PTRLGNDRARSLAPPQRAAEAARTWRSLLRPPRPRATRPADDSRGVRRAWLGPQTPPRRPRPATERGGGGARSRRGPRRNGGRGKAGDGGRRKLRKHQGDADALQEDVGQPDREVARSGIRSRE